MNKEYWEWAKQRYMPVYLRAGDLVYVDANFRAHKMKRLDRSNAKAIGPLTRDYFGYVWLGEDKYMSVRAANGRLQK